MMSTFSVLASKGKESQLQMYDGLPLIENFWLNAVLRSYAMFFFVDGPYGGILAVFVVLISDWWLGLASLVTAISANVFAVYALDAPNSGVHDGIVGLNAVQLGLCLALTQPAHPSMILPLIVLPWLCMFLQDRIGNIFRQFGLKPMGIPSLLVTMLWRLALSDTLRIFPPLLAGAGSEAKLDLFSAPYAIATGAANVGFIAPGFIVLVLLSVAWLLARPTPLYAIWCGASLGVMADAVTGAPLAHIWTGMSGLNSLLVFTALADEPTIRAYGLAAAASFSAGMMASSWQVLPFARMLGMPLMTWPCHFVLLIIQLAKSVLNRDADALRQKAE